MIFISHKHNPDHEIALYFKEILNQHNINTWLAPESVPVGQSFAETIPPALRMCEKVLLILTPDTLRSKHVVKEIDFAIRYNKEIVPVQMRGCELSDEFDYLLSNVQIRIWNENTKDEIINELISSTPVYEVIIKNSPLRKMTLMRGNFQENLDYALKNSLFDLNKTVVVTGLDRSSDLSISTTKGITRDLCRYIEQEYHFSIAQMQELINQAKIEQLQHTTVNQGLNYGDSVLIRIPIQLNITANDYLQILFIANSEKIESFSSTRDVDGVIGIDSREIVLRAFNRCMALGEAAETIFIGAMGTNALSFPYEVVTAEIMNSYLYTVKAGKSPNNLFYSVRNEDMQKSGVTGQAIYNYIRNVVNFF